MRFLVDELESLGYRWAYRLVDSRFTGVPQRRQRVVLVASKVVDPAAVLLEKARLGVNSGIPFGKPGKGHVRINYATSEQILDEIIDRVGAVVDAQPS